MDPPLKSGKYDKNNEDYIQTLNERNRLKKIMNAKSEQERLLEEREKGFTTHFAGANTTNTKPTTVKPTVRGSSFKNLKPKSEGVRRGWGTDGPKFILGQKGPVPIRADKDVVVSQHQTEWNQHLSTDIDEDEEIAESSSLRKNLFPERRGCDEDEDENENFRDDQSTVMEDSLNDVPDEDEEDPYAYEEDFEADDYEAEEANDSEEEVEFRDRKSSTWKEGVTSPKSTPWKSVARTYDQTPTSTISTISPSPSTKAGKGATAISPAPVSSTLIDVDAHETKSKNNHHLQKVESSHTPRQDSSETVKSPSKGDLAEAIALRLASMSEEQQRQLLQMLNLVDHAPNVRQSIEQTKEEPQKDKIHSRDDPSLQIQAPAPKNDAIRISPSITRVSPDISQEQLPVDLDYKSSISTSNHEEPRFETSLAELTTIKIKLHNNWRKTKYSSLASIRLLECGSNRDIDLSNFSSQVWVGNTMLPKSSEVAHSVSLLFARSRVRQHKDWKFPIESGAQLILTGNMSVPLSDLELLIWNGITDAVATSPVRDADVYINNTLLWSGVLSEPTKDHIISLRGLDNSPRILCVTPNEGRSPSNVIAFSSNLNDSKKATVVTTIPLNPSKKHQSKAEISKIKSPSPLPDESFTFSGLASSNFSTTDFEKSAQINEDSSVPSWLSDLKTPRLGIASQTPIEFDPSEENSAEIPKPISRPGSRRAKAEAEALKVDHPPPKQPSSRGSRRHPKNLETPTEKIDSSASTHKPQPKKKSRREVQEDDMTLRQSLDALNDSDRKNRGRLQQELTTAVISGSVEYPSPVNQADQQGIPLEATVAVNLRMKALDNLSGEVLDQELQSNVQKAVLRQRSERIDRVQEKVSSALASLAGVISTLPGGSKSGSSLDRNIQTRITSEPAIKESKLVHSSPVDDKVYRLAEDNKSLSSITNDAKQNEQNRKIDEDISKILEMVNGLDMEMSQSVFVQDDKGVSSNLSSGMLPEDSFLESSLRETPLFPKGKVLEIIILSTWGDPYYVGLNGIDIFDSQGRILTLHEGIKSITSNPSDINILPEYHDDPRIVRNLLDQVNFTRDDLHVWLAPHGSTLTPKLPFVATILIELSQITTLSMIRIWNYNKSRTHCYRGAKNCQIKFDSKLLYEGSIRMAPGLISCSDDCHDMIVFCNDKNIFKKILEYDMSIGYQAQGKEFEPSLQFINGKTIDGRPTTADTTSTSNQQHATSATSSVLEEKIIYRKKLGSKSPLPYEKVVQVDGIRPTTAAIRQDEVHSKSSHHLPVAHHSSSQKEQEIMGINENEFIECESIAISIDQTWGDNCYVGLAGIEILNLSHHPIDLDSRMIDASPRDLSSIGFYGDPRTPDKLIDGINDTTDDTHMWLIPFTKGSKHILKFSFEKKIKIKGFNIWNYNKSPIDILRGARILTIYADSTLLGSIELRIAPGCDGISFQQTILIPQIIRLSNFNRPIRSDTIRYVTPALRQDYEVPLLPSGMCWKITLHSNWGDGYYIGLDGLEFLDINGEAIDLNTKGRIVASPYSLRDIGVQDSRVPSNLANQPYSDPTGSSSWLTPLAQCMTENEKLNSLKYLEQQQRGYNPSKKSSSTEQYEPLFYDENVLFIFFNQPITVSAIRFYNYTKTPKRGVKEFTIEIDGNIVSMGTLRSAENLEFVTSGQSIVFSNDPKITRMEKNKIYYCGSAEQDVLCINERQVIIRSKFMYDPPSVASEGIYSDLSNRPTTALIT